MLTYLLFAIGFPALIKGADWMVTGASNIAQRFGISDIVIGLTIVSIGTSAPELIVNIYSSIQNQNDLAIANILGSNIANILLMLGIAACIRTLKVPKDTIWKEIPFTLLAVLILGILLNDTLFGFGMNILSQGDALVLLAFFIIFL